VNNLKEESVKKYFFFLCINKMSFYDTTNPTRFNIITPKRAVAPFGALNRLSSTVALSSGAAVAGDITLTAEQLKNGSLIANGNGTVSAGTDGSGSKVIAAAATQNDARLTPVLIQFTAVGEDGTAAYSLY